MAQIPTRCSCIDDCIGGGIKPQTITLIYGEPETGKTTLAMQLAVNCPYRLLCHKTIDKKDDARGD